jgi:Kdo2-lipid IVA lauroyltransferase/acyltransferase
MAGQLSVFLQSEMNLFLYRMFGWNTAKIMVFFLGWLHFLLNFQDRRRITEAVHQVVGCGMPIRKFARLLSSVFKGILSHYYEKLYIAFEQAPKATKFLKTAIEADGLDLLREKMKSGKGIIVVTGHYGAIEYIPTFLAVSGFPVSMIAKFKTEQLRKKVFRQAEIYGIRLLDAGSGMDILRTAVKELKENRIVVTECDEMEEWRPSSKQFISFLGRRTGLDRTINALNKRTGAEVVFALIHRHSLAKYRFIAHPVKSEGQDNRSVGSELLRMLEWYILKYPEQWYQWKNYFLIGGSSEVHNRRIIDLKPPLTGPVPAHALQGLLQSVES